MYLQSNKSKSKSPFSAKILHLIKTGFKCLNKTDYVDIETSVLVKRESVRYALLASNFKKKMVVK